MLFNKKGRSFNLGTDSIGIYPCYYYLEGKIFAVSDSLILISKAIQTIEIDEAGVFQRMVYEYSILVQELS
jgi:hypothetical protein